MKTMISQYKFFMLITTLFFATSSVIFALEDTLPSENDTIEINLSNTEVQEIFANPDLSYVCLSDKISNLKRIIEDISTIDQNEGSFVHALKKHMELGFIIGRQEAVEQVLNYAKTVLEDNNSQLDSEQAGILAQELAIVTEQVTKGLLSFDAEKLSFLKDLINKEETEENSAA